METGASHVELLTAIGTMAVVVALVWKLLWDQTEKRFTERDHDRDELKKRVEFCENDRRALNEKLSKQSERIASLEGQLLFLNKIVPVGSFTVTNAKEGTPIISPAPADTNATTKLTP